MTSRLTSLEAGTNLVREMFARASTSVATATKLRRRVVKLEQQLGIVVEQRRQLMYQQQQQQL